MKILTLSAATGLYLLLQPTDPFTRTFNVQPSELRSSGGNEYFSLKPGHQQSFVDGDERLVITVLHDTLRIDGVQTRVVEERETKAGTLVEVSRNYFAVSSRTGDVYYFGEDVDMYAKGKVTSHEGSWRSGVAGATFGLAMPAKPVLHQRYYQEYAPKVALDRAEIVSVSETHRVPNGVSYTDVVRVEETTPLEPGVKEYKLYVRGIGLIADGSLELTSINRIRK